MQKALLSHIDPDGLREFSVVYTDRALNHMSHKFVQTMQYIQRTLAEVYGAHTAAFVPGSGTFGMEAVARQFAVGQRVLIVRNGFFSYRWSQILEQGQLTAPEHITVCKARPVSHAPQAAWIPAPVEAVCAAIAEQRPALVFAPHVETASGIVLPDDYLRQIAQATHAVGGLFVLDCIASGALWINMQQIGVDVLITAPQKGWSSTPCGAWVCLSDRARAAIEATTSNSFACDLKKWLTIAEGYTRGQHAYHATMPTDGIAAFAAAMQETAARGFEIVRQQQIELGQRIRALLQERGFPSVAAPGYEASGVVVCYTSNPEMQSGRAFVAHGMQAASGVPLMCDEPADFSTFRLGLFGLDKWADVEGSVAAVQQVLDAMAS